MHVVVFCDFCRPECIVCDTPLYTWQRRAAFGFVILAMLLFGVAARWWHDTLPALWLGLFGTGLLALLAAGYIVRLDEHLFATRHYLRPIYLE